MALVRSPGGRERFDTGDEAREFGPEIFLPARKHPRHLVARMELHEDVERLVLQSDDALHGVGNPNLATDLVGDDPIGAGGARREEGRGQRDRKKNSGEFHGVILVPEVGRGEWMQSAILAWNSASAQSFELRENARAGSPERPLQSLIPIETAPAVCRMRACEAGADRRFGTFRAVRTVRTVRTVRNVRNVRTVTDHPRVRERASRSS